MIKTWIKAVALSLLGCTLLFSARTISKRFQGSQEDEKARVSIGLETTHISEPLDDAGYVDYQKAINDFQFAGLDPEDNFSLVLWQVLGVDSVKKSDRQAFFGPMSFDGAAASTLSPWVDAEAFFSTYPFKSIRDERTSRAFLDGPFLPWQQPDSPAIEFFLSKNKKQLDFLATGLERSKFAQPYVCDTPPKLIGSMLYGILELKQMGRMFAKRAMLHQGNGDLDKALEDALACHRIGCFLIRRATDLEVQTGFEVCRWAAETEKSILGDDSLNRRQTVAHLNALLKTPATRDLADVFGRFCRWNVLEIAQLNARYIGKPDAPPAVKGTFPIGVEFESIDFDESMRVINDWYDRGVAALNGETHQEVLSDIEEIYRDLNVLSNRMKNQPEESPQRLGRNLGAIWVTQLYTDLKGLFLSSVQTKSEFRLVVTGYAVRLYEIENNEFPKVLDEQLVKYLQDKNLYMDPSTGQPFQLEEDNEQLVISASTENGKRRVIIIPKSRP